MPSRVGWPTAQPLPAMKARTASATSCTAIADSSRPAIRVTSTTPPSRSSRRIGRENRIDSHSDDVHQHDAERDRHEVGDVVDLAGRAPSWRRSRRARPAAGVPSGTSATLTSGGGGRRLLLAGQQLERDEQEQQPAGALQGGQRDAAGSRGSAGRRTRTRR